MFEHVCKHLALVCMAAIFDTGCVPAPLRPYVPLFCSVVAAMGAADLDYKYVCVNGIHRQYVYIYMYWMRRWHAGT